MWFEDFARKAREEVFRWEDRLEQEGINALRSSYDAIGELELKSFAQDNLDFVDRLLRARSSRDREKILMGAPDVKNRHALLLSAYWQARYGLAWLESASGRSLEPSPGETDKNVCANAAAAARAMLDVNVPIWAFDE